MKTEQQLNTEQALKLVRQLAVLMPKRGVQSMMAQIEGWIKMPMELVLSKVPGATVRDKCHLVGVSRQAWYAWLRGESRPNPSQAKRLAELTGLDAEAIRGREILEPKKKRLRPRSRPAPARAAR